jgi:uncharacterized protein with HEPN domain
VSHRDYSDYLQDMLDSINDIESFTHGMSYTTFRDDRKTIYAVTRCIEIIGEGANKIPKYLKDQYPEIPWVQVAGMRNKMIHEYFGVDVSILWQTIEDDIPFLKNAIEEIINSLG